VKRLLLDQGLPRSAADLLNARGWNTIHVAAIGMSRATDTEILAHARAESRVCVTLDADFHALLVAADALGPSVIRIRKEGLGATALADLIASIWPEIANALAQGAMVTVTDRTIRTRLLPVPGSP
jgi:predicted nuclease of predicted toxin-antitoxin system